MPSHKASDTNFKAKYPAKSAWAVAQLIELIHTKDVEIVYQLVLAPVFNQNRWVSSERFLEFNQPVIFI